MRSGHNSKLTRREPSLENVTAKKARERKTLDLIYEGRGVEEINYMGFSKLDVIPNVVGHVD